jgi:hypothetical protein
MPFSVVAARFDTALHAWWSAFFDQLGVPWLYRPQAFTDASGGTFRPAFWLPHARIWFDADPLGPPPGWQRFACAAAGCVSNCHLEIWGEPFDGPHDDADGHSWHDADTDGTHLPLHDVDEAWRGTALFASGPLPDTYSAAGPWESHPDSGMRTHNDGAYQWTMCPRCDWCGAEFFGRAERLACGCLGDAEEHNKTYNSADPRLLAAYTAAHHAADEEFTAADPEHDADIDARTPVLRLALVARADDAEAQARCRSACRPLSDDLLHGIHPVAAQAVTADLADARWICLGCDGTVCGNCGSNPTAAAGVPCRTCEPTPLLSRRHATRVLDSMAAELGRRHKVPVAAVHGRLKRVMGVRTRSQASLHQLALAMTATEDWLDHHTPGQFNPPLPDPDTVQALQGAELRAAVNTLVPPTARKLHLPIPVLQARLNRAIGLPGGRSGATDEHLQAAAVLLRRWHDDPNASDAPRRSAPASPRHSPADTRIPLPAQHDRTPSPPETAQ